MTPTLILLIFLAYTALLFAVTWITARRANNQSFYIGIEKDNPEPPGTIILCRELNGTRWHSMIGIGRQYPIQNFEEFYEEDLTVVEAKNKAEEFYFSQINKG